jgi:hypothetical protein
MTLSGKDFYTVDQLVGAYLGEDWMHEFDGEYEAAETWVREASDSARTAFVREVDSLFALTAAPEERRTLFSTQYSFTRDNGRFDVWLRAVRVRAAQALAGIHSEPLVDPSAD